MKRPMIICPENRQQEVRELIAKSPAHSHSEIPTVLGQGKAGKPLGMSILAFPVESFF